MSRGLTFPRGGIGLSSSRTTSTIVLVLAVFAAGCSAPGATTPSVEVPDGTAPADGSVAPQSVNGSTGSVGGSVRNSAPTVESFTQSATTGENRGAFVVVFSGSVKDKNTESQIQNVSVTGLGPSVLGANHVVTADDRAATVEPSSFGADGFKVWNTGGTDGVLAFKYQQTFPAFTPAGTYAFTARVTDTPGLTGLGSALSVVLTAFSDITISATPVSLSGASLPGANWGSWEAEPGAANVEATNYIKLVNTGDIADSRVVIDFADAFVGADDANFTIPVANNLAFFWFEDTTPGTTAPNEGTVSYLPVNADGTTTVQFSGRDNVIYVTYRLASLPAVLPVQAYGISFTVTEL